MDVLLLYEVELLLQDYEILGRAPEYDVKWREIVEQQKDLFQVTQKFQNTASEYPFTQVQTKYCKCCSRSWTFRFGEDSLWSKVLQPCSRWGSGTAGTPARRWFASPWWTGARTWCSSRGRWAWRRRRRSSGRGSPSRTRRTTSTASTSGGARTSTCAPSEFSHRVPVANCWFSCSGREQSERHAEIKLTRTGTRAPFGEPWWTGPEPGSTAGYLPGRSKQNYYVHQNHSTSVWPLTIQYRFPIRLHQVFLILQYGPKIQKLLVEAKIKTTVIASNALLNFTKMVIGTVSTKQQHNQNR